MCSMSRSNYPAICSSHVKINIPNRLCLVSHVHTVGKMKSQYTWNTKAHFIEDTVYSVKCIVAVCVFVSSILFWFPQRTHYFSARWHVFYIRNRHISVSSFVYKYDQWPHDRKSRCLRGRRHSSILYSPSGFFSSYFISEVNFRGMCFRIIHFILISTAHALFLTCLPVSIYGT
jgi:hypothetical protein